MKLMAVLYSARVLQIQQADESFFVKIFYMFVERIILLSIHSADTHLTDHHKLT